MQDSIPRFSLSRQRHLEPAPPYWLGGEFIEIDGAPFLRDAFGAVKIQGDREALKPGDLVEVLVAGSDGKFSEVRKLRDAHRERLAPSHALTFTQFVDQVRRFLKSRGMSEVFTPTRVTCPGLEPSLKAFRVGDKFLPTSPEISLKKAMARGLTDIFEIRPCFRRDESSPHHGAEFYMLEWYRGFADLNLVIEDLRALLVHLGVVEELRVTDFAALFKGTLKFDLTPKTTRAQLLPLVENPDQSDTFTDLFHRLMIDKIEPVMAKMGPLVVRHFPPSMAALARMDESGWADRFEFYWNGLEIANAFNEVTDPDEQTRRWEGEQAERKRLETGELPTDPELIEALRIGLPPTGGIALGLERLYMALHGLKDIRECSLFR